MIHLSLNNQPTTLDRPLLLQEALEFWGYGSTRIAVAINGDFVPRSRYGEQLLADGDEVDIVKPVGGG